MSTKPGDKYVRMTFDSGLNHKVKQLMQRLCLHEPQ